MLADILATLLTQAKADKPRRQYHAFEGGAYVCLYVDDTDQLHFMVRRSDVFPSLTEWRTFIRHLPATAQPSLIPTPKEQQTDQGYYFTGVWPMQVALFELPDQVKKNLSQANPVSDTSD